MIKLANVSLRRGSRVLFDHASVTLHEGMRTGVTGANGVGKTSLFALLEGQLQADTGEVEVTPGTRIASVRQEVEAVQDTALEFVIAGDQALSDARTSLDSAERAGDGHALALAHERIAHLDGYTAETRAARLLAGLGFSGV